MKAHKAANEFPMMDDQRFNSLVEDIETNGQRVPIIICDGQILDGRNRHKACLQLGIQPKTEMFDGDPWAYVWSLNGERRDLVADQRYLIWKHCHEQSASWRHKAECIKKSGDKKRSATQKQNTKGSVRTSCTTTPTNTTEKDKTRKAKAEASKTNMGAVARGDKLAKDRPDLAARVRQGEMKPTEAYRTMKKDQVSDKVAELPDNKYRVIYADPPWQYNDSKAGLNIGAAEDHYPTMATSEICALNIKELAQDDAVLFCWATFPLLTDALEVVKAWGFKYKTSFVWDKVRPNFGNYHNATAELLLVCTRGSGTPDEKKREDQVQVVERTGRHSEKPEHFRQMIDRLYKHGKKIELFRRGKAPKGWEVWGNESV